MICFKLDLALKHLNETFENFSAKFTKEEEGVGIQKIVEKIHCLRLYAFVDDP